MELCFNVRNATVEKFVTLLNVELRSSWESKLNMSSRSGDISGKHEHVQPKAAESTGRDEARQRSFTQRGYHYMLERKLSSFKKEMTEFKKAIDEANDAYISEDIATLEVTLPALEIMKIGFESAFHGIDELFVQDKWGDFDETSQDVRKKSRTLMNLIIRIGYYGSNTQIKGCS